MASITWADVTNIASELSGIALGAQTIYLADANTAFSVAAFGGEDADRLKLVRSLYAAHMATVGPASGGTSGAVTAESAGEVSRSYASPSGGSLDDLDASSYGKTLKRLIRIAGGGPRVI